MSYRCVHAFFCRHWHAELQKPGKPSLGTACWKTVRPLFIYALPCKVSHEIWSRARSVVAVPTDVQPLFALLTCHWAALLACRSYSLTCLNSWAPSSSTAFSTLWQTRAPQPGRVICTQASTRGWACFDAHCCCRLAVLLTTVFVASSPRCL